MKPESLERLNRIAHVLEKSESLGPAFAYMAQDIWNIIHEEGPFSALTQAEIRMLDAGLMINAIKALRERVPGTDLKTAKDIVDAYMKAHNTK